MRQNLFLSGGILRAIHLANVANQHAIGVADADPRT